VLEGQLRRHDPPAADPPSRALPSAVAPPPALSPQDSRRLQYALSERARALGWLPEAMAVVDPDGGQRAASTRPREGFQTLVGQVTWGQLGLSLSYEATRRSRTGSDWYPRVARWGDQGCWMAEVDGLDAPATAHGRRRLGLQGPRSEWALHTIRARLPAGLLHQAAPGDLALAWPTGRERDAQGHGRPEAKRAGQARLLVVLTPFLHRRSASKGRAFFQAHGRRRPRRERFGAVVGQRPPGAALRSILKPPASAGAVTSGRPRPIRPSPAPGRAAPRRLPRTPWRIRVHANDPADLRWEAVEPIPAMRPANHAEDDRNNTRGRPRPGNAVRHGLGYGGAGGPKMGGPSKGGTASRCHSLRQPYRVPLGQYGPAAPLEARVVTACCEARAPVALEV
jgi:DNA invertase Pin-like site-specific DNA recombinase